MIENIGHRSIPLCVDLDGTLIKTDILLESLIALLKVNPFYLFLLPLWLFIGKANLKHQIAKRVTIDIDHLPYNQDLLEYCISEKNQGRKLFLVTATNEKFAGQIANKLKIFYDVFASNININLANKIKADVLISKFGRNNFDYLGNSIADLPVWENCSNVLVQYDTTSRGILKKIERTRPVYKTFMNKKNNLFILLKAIRIHQWIKNVLIFIPIIMAHQVMNIKVVSSGICAFFAFCLCASGMYVFNDLLDIQSDRLNTYKKKRPFASGDLSIQSGIMLIPIFLVVGVALAAFLPIDFLFILFCYILLSMIYSIFLKQIIIIDTLLLAFLYTIRIIAGHEATDIKYSFWLLAFSLFLFYSLALLKRFSELNNLQRQNNCNYAKGRGYGVVDIIQLAIIGSSSGLLAVLILALYINSSEVTILYDRPMFLWFICPLILYWISRIWLLAGRGQIHEDPIIFAIKDRLTYGIGFLILLIMGIATHF